MPFGFNSTEADYLPSGLLLKPPERWRQKRANNLNPRTATSERTSRPCCSAEPQPHCATTTTTKKKTQKEDTASWQRATPTAWRGCDCFSTFRGRWESGWSFKMEVTQKETKKRKGRRKAKGKNTKTCTNRYVGKKVLCFWLSCVHLCTIFRAPAWKQRVRECTLPFPMAPGGCWVWDGDH